MRLNSRYEIECDFKENELLREKNDLEKSKFLVKKSIDLFETKFSKTSVSPVSLKQIEFYMKSIDLYAKRKETRQNLSTHQL